MRIHTRIQRLEARLEAIEDELSGFLPISLAEQLVGRPLVAIPRAKRRAEHEHFLLAAGKVVLGIQAAMDAEKEGGSHFEECGQNL